MSALWLPEGTSRSDLGDEFRYATGESHQVVPWDFYHRKPVPPDSTRSVFFDQNVGTALNFWSDTNSEMSSTMPGGQAFILDGLGVLVTGKARRLWREAMAPHGSLEIQILNRRYRRMPLSILPVLDDQAPLHTIVTRESKAPGRAWKVVTRKETARLYPLTAPRLVIGPYRYYVVQMDFYPRLEIREPVPVGVVLTGWLVRANL